MSYTTNDFSESLSRVGVEPTEIDAVIAAWGGGDGQGSNGGKGWSEESVTEWAGGFLFRLRDGRYAYVEGWCDYTGWGCRDGAEIVYFETLPEKSTLGKMDTKPHDWDDEPADLNKWLRTQPPGDTEQEPR